MPKNTGNFVIFGVCGVMGYAVDSRTLYFLPWFEDIAY
jgi:hypothetical protein